MPSILEGVFSSSEDELNKMLVSLVGMPKDQIEAELSAIKSRVEEVAQTIPTKGNKGDKGDKGDQGIQGPKGEPGRDGRDGFIGKDGKQGIDGKDGKDGKDGVSIVDVNVAFDNHLVVTLSDGTEIDAGVIGSLNENLQNVVANYVSNGANGTLIFKGLWNASTNTPTLSLSSSDAGAYYVVSVAGSTNLSGITDWQVNDWAIFNGTEWQKIDNSDLFNPSAVAITGGSINGTTIGATTATTGRFSDLTDTGLTSGRVTYASTGGNLVDSANLTFNGTTFTSAQQTNLATSSGNVQVGSTTATEKLDVSGGGMIIRGTTNQTASNGGLYLGTSGSTSTLTAINPAVQWFNMSFSANQFSFLPQNAEQFRISHTASAVNYVQVTGGATGNSTVIYGTGSDTNVNTTISAKGFSSFINFTASGTTDYTAFSISTSGASNTGNRFQVVGSATTKSPIFSTVGSDTNISMAFQPKGTGAIDLAAGSSGVNISNGGTVTAITRTVTSNNYTSIPTLTISPPTTAGGVQAVATTTMLLAQITSIGSGGTGYTVGDVLTMVGATGADPNGRVTVSSVSGGVITAVTVSNNGNMTTIPANPFSVTGGTGTGATFNGGYGLGGTFNISNAGSGYIEQPTVTFSGGGGSGAAAYASVGTVTTIKGIGSAQERSIQFQGPNGFNILELDGTSTNTTAETIRIQPTQFGRTNIVAVGGTNSQMWLSASGSGYINFCTSGTSLTSQMRVTHTASAVNYVQVTGAVTSGSPTISAQGSDSNIPLNIRSKGVFNINFQNGNNNNGLVVDMTSGGTLANYVAIAGKVAGTAPTISALGTDTNISLVLASKGTGSTQLYANGAASFAAAAQTSAVNYGIFTGTATGTSPLLQVAGTDTNIDFRLRTQGTGAYQFDTGSNANTQLRVSNTASAVNFVQVTGGATGVDPNITIQGSDANRGLAIGMKGTGVLSFYSNGVSNRQLRIDGSVAAVNSLNIVGSIAGQPPQLGVNGSDTNIDLALTPKGTGVVQFGTHTANADVAISGFITIRDAGGTLRKLAVIT